MANKAAVKRRQEKQDKHNHYWEKFRSILQAVQDCGEALALALAMPQQDVPQVSHKSTVLSSGLHRPKRVKPRGTILVSGTHSAIRGRGRSEAGGKAPV